MKLDRCKRGQTVKVCFIDDALMRAQAIRFGIGEGEIINCSEIVPAGPVVIRKNHQEIAIGRRLAGQIEVELVGYGSKKAQ